MANLFLLNFSSLPVSPIWWEPFQLSRNDAFLFCTVQTHRASDRFRFGAFLSSIENCRRVGKTIPTQILQINCCKEMVISVWSAAAVWPDLAKLCHFDQIISLAKMSYYFVFGKILHLLWHICYAVGLFLTDVNGQNWTNHLVALKCRFSYRMGCYA